MPITSLIARALVVCSITLAIALPSTPVHAADKTSLQKQTKQKKKKASTRKKRSTKLINKLKHSVKTTPQSENVHYLEWKEVLDFIEHMHTQHQFEREQLRLIFEQVRYVESAVQFIKPAPPGTPKNWKAYRARFVENGRIEAGVAFWERNNEALNRAQERFGVPAEIIAGLIGVETIFGKNTGSFRAIDALTTLAFSYPDTPTREARMQFFKNELAQLLLWTRERHIPLFELKASYAGAIGLAQFMPSSLRNFSIDFDGDGNIDLKQSEADAIGSVANYLSLHGWKKDLPYAFPATLSSEQVDEKQLQEVLAQGLKASYRLDQLNSLVSTADALAPKTINYGLIDLQNGNDPTEYWFATENFFAITRYNRSYFYAMSVIDLGQVIRLAKQKPE